MEHRIGNKHLSDAVKAKIIALKNFTNMTYAEIAKQCDCSVGYRNLISIVSFNNLMHIETISLIKEYTCKYWWLRYEKKHNFETIPRSGRPRKTNVHQDDEIVKKIQTNPFLSAAQIGRSFHVSRTTISNRLHENNINCYISARQTKLTEEARINRYAYFESFMENNDQQQIDDMVFSDEKIFKSDVVRQIRVYRPPNSRYDEHYLSEDNLSGRISASYWGAIGVEGPLTNLVRIHGHFNKEKYVETLQTHLVPAMERFKGRTFMQDNSPVHTAEIVSDFLTKQTFKTMPWPPYSPDVNPIENVWAYMTKNWPSMENRSLDALDSIVQEKWNELRHNPSISYFPKMIYFILIL